MGKTLQEQLLTAGIVSKKQIKKINSQQRKANRQKQKGGKQAGSEESPQIQQDRDSARQRDKELNRKLQQQKEARAADAGIRQLMESNQVVMEEGEVVYNFAYKGIVRKIHVTGRVKAQISKGGLAIVDWGQGYRLIPGQVAERIRAMNSDYLILYNDPGSAGKAEDEGYPDHRVPDDLVW